MTDLTGEALQKILGQIIDKVWFDKKHSALVVEAGGTIVGISDHGQDCCEERWMTCDDDLEQYAGATLKSVEERKGATEGAIGDEVTETCFLKLVTDRGDITACTHNTHNGYYGGFSLEARARVAPRSPSVMYSGRFQ